MVATLELDEDVLGLVAELSGAPLPGDGPSWEAVTVDGLERGRGAVVQRLHHSLADGVDAVRLWRRLQSDGEPSERAGSAGERSVPPAARDTAALVTSVAAGAARMVLDPLDPAAVTHPPCSWHRCGVPSARSSVPALPASSRRFLPSAPGATNYKPAVVRRPVAMFRRPTHRAWRGRTARPRPRRGRR